MTAYKEKQFLVFDLPDGKNVKYDLSTGKMIGKNGLPVKSLSSQLYGYNIEDVIDAFADEKYKDFLKYVRNQTKYAYSYSNVGTFLSKIRYFLHLEGYFSACITSVNRNTKTPITDVPKGFLDIVRKYGVEITDGKIRTYKRNPNIIRNIFDMDFRSITYRDIELCILDDGYCCDPFWELINKYTYNYESLIRYIDNIMTFEGIEHCSNLLRELRDYARMASSLSKKFDKYPDHFLTSHHIMSRNYSRLKREFPEELFQRRIKPEMEYSFGGFKIIYPKSTQDIKDEAVSQSNCLASYIDYVLDGKADILFMRAKDDIDSSLITLEVRGGSVVQARGRRNRLPTHEEEKIIEKYNERLKKYWR